MPSVRGGLGLDTRGPYAAVLSVAVSFLFGAFRRVPEPIELIDVPGCGPSDPGWVNVLTPSAPTSPTEHALRTRVHLRQHAADGDHRSHQVASCDSSQRSAPLRPLRKAAAHAGGEVGTVPGDQFAVRAKEAPGSNEKHQERKDPPNGTVNERPNLVTDPIRLPQGKGRRRPDQPPTVSTVFAHSAVRPADVSVAKAHRAGLPVHWRPAHYA